MRTCSYEQIRAKHGETKLPEFWPFDNEADWREHAQLRERGYALLAQAHEMRAKKEKR
jgi:hypothetical protein